MTENGIVVKTENGIVVKVDKKTECSKCGMCAFPKNASHIDLKATSEIAVKVGDEVTVETSESLRFLSALLVFGVPLVLIGACALIGLLVFKSDIITLVSAVVITALYFVVLHFIDKKILKNKKFITKIIAVTKKAED